MRVGILGGRVGGAALEKLGASQAEIAEIRARIRERDQKRLQLELAGGIRAGRALFSGTSVQAGQSEAVKPPKERR
jgi:glutathione-regulated potassium-efflux system protein KefB